MYFLKKLITPMNAGIIILSSYLFIQLYLFGGMLYGDGLEYLSMIIAFCNHFSPELTANDISQTMYLSGITNWNLVGFFADFAGNLYSYHFFLYSLLGMVVYIPMNILELDIKYIFLVLNYIIMLFSIFYMNYCSELPIRKKYLVIFMFVVNPAILYLKWSHPEIMIYSFFYLSVLSLYERKLSRAALWAAFASLQASILAVVVFGCFFCVCRMYDIKEHFCKYILSGISCIIALIPYAFYYLHYGVFSLISKCGAANIHNISFLKIYSIFFDLNFGLIVYVPILLLVVVYKIYRKDQWSICMGMMALILVIASSVQSNWNPGIDYIHRYAIWIMPTLVFPLLSLNFNKKSIWVILVYLCTTLPVIGYCTVVRDSCNYIKIQPLAKYAILVAPSFYNPYKEILVERAIGGERGFEGRIIFEDSNHGVRKMMIVNQNECVYLNGEFKLYNLLNSANRHMNIIIEPKENK